MTVYFSDSIGGRRVNQGGWDTHGFDNTRMYEIVDKYQLPITDQTLPTLLDDLEDRGLLDETLVVWMGEFGRTPEINKNLSRDHWPQCYTALLAGGGVKGGYVYGKSDELAKYPAEKPVRPEDLAATIYPAAGHRPVHRDLRSQQPAARHRRKYAARCICIAHVRCLPGFSGIIIQGWPAVERQRASGIPLPAAGVGAR